MGLAAAAAVAGLGYAAGVRRLARRGRRWPASRSWAFAGAVAAALGAAAVGDATFTRHMGEHLLLGMVAPLLAALAAPVTLALQAGGPATRAGLRRLLHGPAGRLLARPLLGFALFAGGLVLLYLTPLVGLSATNRAVHLAVHAHLLASGLAFLVPLAGVDPLPRPVPPAARLLVLGLSVPFHAVVGLALASAGEPVAPAAYPSLDDQRRAASLLWGSGEVLTVAAAAVVFVRWWRAEQRAAHRALRSRAGC